VPTAGVNPDAPTPRAVWSRPDALRNFSIVRKLDGRPWPTGFEALIASENRCVLLSSLVWSKMSLATYHALGRALQASAQPT
jgi:hypothetical protein